MNRPSDIITPEVAGTLGGLFRERVQRTPDGCAYRSFDHQGRCCECSSWTETATLAALGLGLVTVPLYVNDRPDNFTLIIQETESRILLIEGVEQWERIRQVPGRLDSLLRIVSLTPACTQECDPRLVLLADWLPAHADSYDAGGCPPDALASLVYTSGTTGRPKGVMLSHANILANTYAGISRVPIYPDDLFLSFLPLSHTLKRTAGYYVLMMAGANVAHCRSLEQLSDDLTAIRPTIIITVPRVFERIHREITGRLAAGPHWKRRLFDLASNVGWRRFLHSQGRGGWSPFFLLWPLLDRLVAERIVAALGGRIRLAISGGTPLNPEIARFFIALGLNILQGYGLTETSPVISVNTEADNRAERDVRLLAQSGRQRSSGHRSAGVAAYRRSGPYRRQRPYHHHGPYQGDHCPGQR